MEANLNAIGIILVPIFAIAVSLIWGTKYDEIRFLKAVLIPLSIIIVIVIILTFLPSDLNLSFALQLFLPIICLFPILWFVEKKIVRYSASFILLVLALCLSIQCRHLALSDKYAFTEGRRLIAQNNLQRLGISMMLYAVAENDSNVYPEGWLAESQFIANLPKQRQESIKTHRIFTFDQPQTYPLWHSAFTHLYEIKPQYSEAWYPGGKLRDSIGKISLKERKEKQQTSQP